MTLNHSSLTTILWSGAALLLLLGLSACGNDELSCGSNTTNENGRCVLVEGTATSCGDGTRVSTTGACVPDRTGCGPGTAYSSEQQSCVPASNACADGATFDPDSNTCVAASSCGPNTTMSDGECVLDQDALCNNQTGVTFNSDSGRCEVTMSSCGPGTTRSAESNDCVIAEDSCGDGLAINDQGECVPTDQLCNDDSTFKRIGGEPACVPDVTCDEGDVVLQTDMDPATPGVCVSPAEKLAANSDVTDSEIGDPMADNDPSTGTPDTLMTKPVGQTASYSGVINASSGQDIDAFSFMGNEGQWFNLAVQSTGLPQPFFTIEGPGGYERHSALGLDGDPARQIALPRNGEYTVSIKPTIAVTGPAGPYNGEDWSYVATLEQTNPPQRGNLPTVDFSASMNNTATGSLAGLTDNFHQVNGLMGAQLAEFTVDTVGSQGDAVLQTWASPSDFTAGDAAVEEGDSVVLPLLRNNNAPIIAADWVRATGPNLDYEISASAIQNTENIGSVAAGSSTMSSQQTIQQGNDFYFLAQFEGGQLIEMSQTNNEQAAIDYTVKSGTGATIREEQEMPATSQRVAEDHFGSGYFYVQDSGTYVINVEAASSTGLTNLQLTFDSSAPNDLGAFNRGDMANTTISNGIAAGRSAFHTLNANESALANLTVNAVAPTGNETVDLTVRRASDYSVVAEDNADGEVSLNEFGLSDGPALIQIGAPSQIAEYEVSFRLLDIVPEIEPNDTRANATIAPLDKRFQGGENGNGDTDWWGFTLNSDLDADETLFVRAIGPYEPSGYDCAFRDSSGNLLSQKVYENRENGCALFGSGLSAGTYYMEMIVDDLPGGYTGSATIIDGVVETEPNDSQSNPNAYPSSALPSPRQAFFGVHNDDQNDENDWFEVSVPSSLPSGKDLIFGVDAVGPENEWGFDNLEYSLYDGSGSQIGSTKDFNAQWFTESASNVSAGSSYTVHMEHEDASSAQDNHYFLNAEFFGPDQTVSGSTGVTIPDNDPNGISETVTVSNCMTVDEVFLELDITADRRGDFQIYLEGPTGQRTFVEKQYDNNDDTESPDLIEIYPLTELPLIPFTYSGTNGNGTWTLEIADLDSEGGDNTLNSWSLHLNCQ